jgi:transcriptional regulator of acetoin/glycerol metabolism
MSFHELDECVTLDTLEGSQAPTSLSNLESLWDQFSQSHSIPSQDLRPCIVNSWQRCQSLQVNPLVHAPARLSARQFEERVEAFRDYLEVIEPVLDRVEKLMEASQHLLSFVDRDGYILYINGDDGLREAVGRLNFRLGSNWSERFAGTTAVGVALATGRPSQVFHAEHFCKELHGFTCTAVPILDPFTDDILGVLDFVSDVQNHQAHTMGMAMQMSHCIQLEIYRAKKEEEDVFRECSVQLTLNELKRGVIVLDRNQQIRRMNLMALDYLGMHDEEFLDKRLGDLPAFAGWRPQDRQASLELPGGRVRVVRKSLRHNQRVMGSLIFIEPHHQERKGARAGGEPPAACCQPLGESFGFQAVLRKARHAARCGSNVLLVGETGTGKEVLARYLHQHSDRSHKPFVAINCGSIPSELLGSELFGYDGGAFTGAKRGGHPSKFEVADGGTLLLDEISEMPLESQVYLLRVLEEHVVTRLGGTKTVPVSVRVIAASNQNLQELVQKGRFRSDLFFRLNVIRLELPRLCERQGDVELLARHFLEALSGSVGRSFQGFSQGALQALAAYHWPGNVRELRNVVEQAMVLSAGEVITFDSLPEYLVNSLEVPEHVSPAERERYLRFIHLWREMGGNVTQVAKALEISRPTVYAWRDKFKVA